MSGFNLSALAVRERSVTLFLIILISVAGIVAFFKLGRAEDPPFTVKSMTVITAWPGATAQEMQDQVAEPLEKRMQELRWYDRTETYTRPGLAFTTVTFLDSTPPAEVPEQFYQAETDLVKTAQALGKLPVLQTSNPMPDGRLNARLADMAAMTRRVAAEQHVPLVDHYAQISAMADWKTHMSDGAHPKPELYRAKAQQDFQVIDPLVRRLFGVAALSQRQSARVPTPLHSTSDNPTRGNS